MRLSSSSWLVRQPNELHGPLLCICPLGAGLIRCQMRRIDEEGGRLRATQTFLDACAFRRELLQGACCKPERRSSPTVQSSPCQLFRKGTFRSLSSWRKKVHGQCLYARLALRCFPIQARPKIPVIGRCVSRPATGQVLGVLGRPVRESSHPR